jgi:hypothetical protein
VQILEGELVPQRQVPQKRQPAEPEEVAERRVVVRAPVEDEELVVAQRMHLDADRPAGETRGDLAREQLGVRPRDVEVEPRLVGERAQGDVEVANLLHLVDEHGGGSRRAGLRDVCQQRLRIAQRPRLEALHYDLPMRRRPTRTLMSGLPIHGRSRSRERGRANETSSTMVFEVRPRLSFVTYD